uniref:Leucine-rich repeat-containing protein 1 n=2 Tax=Cacopsylla melanoneura TaxID=428564 RepID=A0A8D8T7E9_9HEMI
MLLLLQILIAKLCEIMKFELAISSVPDEETKSDNNEQQDTIIEETIVDIDNLTKHLESTSISCSKEIEEKSSSEECEGIEVDAKECSLKETEVRNDKVANTKDKDKAMELIEHELNLCGKQHRDVYTVNLSHQNLTCILESMSEKLTKLVVLNISHNKLSALPDFLNFTSLRELNISHNAFEELPLCVQVYCSKLVKLDVSYNALKILHKPRCTHTLQVFYMNNNCQMKIPEWFWYQEFACLKELNMSSTDPFFDRLPIWLLNHMELKENGVFSNLISLTMQNSGAVMSNVSQLKYLRNIKHLNCSNNIEQPRSQNLLNILWELPSSLAYLISLQELRVSGVELNLIPEDIGNLVCLEVFDISYNRLYKLPDSMSKLKSLKWLNMSHNSIITLPDQFGVLSSLTTLLAQYNDLSELPVGFEALNLVYCDLYSNELAEGSVSVLKEIKTLHSLDVMQNYIKQDLLPLSIQHNLRVSLPESEMRLCEQKVVMGFETTDPNHRDFSDSFSSQKSLEAFSGYSSLGSSRCNSPVPAIQDPTPAPDSLDNSNWDDEPCNQPDTNSVFNEWQNDLPKTCYATDECRLPKSYEEAIEKFRTRRNTTDFIPSDSQVKFFNKRKAVRKFDFLSRAIVEGQFDSV